MARQRDSGFPSTDAIVAFIRAYPGKIGTREIAREFGLKNADRVALKQLLRELANEGIIKKRGKEVSEPETLPATLLADISSRDSDGELLAIPAEWDEVEKGEPPKIRIHIARRIQPGAAAGVGDRALLRVEKLEEGVSDGVAYRGRILKVLDHAKTRVLGIFRKNPDGSGRLIPVDKKHAGRELNIARTDTLSAEDGDLVSVDLVRSRWFGLASGKVRERLGSLATEKAISLIAIHAHDIPQAFSKDALREAEEASPATLKGREDWRDVPLVTIDPPDAKDHDDAVHAEPDPDPNNKGGFIVNVAIADVAFYVRPGLALDRDALMRGNSVYFPDRVVPMLPERISSDLCSLVPGEPRGALAVRMVIGADGRKHSHSFHRILMRSAAKLHYAQAQAAIDGHPDDTTGPLLAPILKPLYAAYATVKRARDERDPLDLDLPERKILLKADGTVDRVIVPVRLDAHKLIEEFMIMANVAAAETLEKHKVPLLYRIHDAPSPEKIEGLKDFLATLDIKLASKGGMRPANFNRILERFEGQAQAQLVNEVVLRSQSQAEYNPLNIGHFGLNLRKYAHFTSPIRRYSDLIVHRALIRALKFGPDGLPEAIDEKLPAIGAEISAAERRAMLAERETKDRLIARFLMDRVGADFTAKISGVTKSGLFVRLDETGADGFIPISTLGAEFFAYDERSRSVVGTKSGETHRLGDAVEVRLVEAQPFAGALRFELLTEGARGKPPPRSGRMATGSRGRTFSKPGGKFAPRSGR